MTTPTLPIYILISICVLSCSAIMVAVWVWARQINNAGVVDVFWAFNFPIIALITYGIAPGWLPRKIAICGMVIAAGLRLGTHLGIRVIGHLAEEEGRYKQLRKEWAPHANRSFFWFFQAQALSNVFLAIPFFVATANTRPTFSTWEYAGIALWFIAFLGESLADRQLATFKKDPANKGMVCNAGLWKYSRHPNYFFEWLQWTAWFIFCLGSPWGWLAAISPLIILYLLLKVTGIPATEEQSLRSKGELYKNYQRQTSVFIPWFKKHP
jgi:steroid 5-alpha reductase family enzyme